MQPSEPTGPGNPDPVQRGADQIRRTLIDIGAIIDGVAARVKDILNEALKAVFEPIGASIEAVVALVGELVSGLLSNLATPADVVTGVWEAWEKLGTTNASPGLALIGFLLAHFGPELHKTLDTLLPHNDTPAIAALNASDPIPPDFSKLWAESQKWPGWWRAIMETWATISLAGVVNERLAGSELSALDQEVARHHPVAQLSPAELANMVVQTVVPQGYGAEQALRSGITPELFDLMVRVTGMPPALGEMLTLWNRGVVKESEVDLAIAESHTKDKYIPSLKELRWHWPTPADIVHWLTRDVWVDEFVKRYGADLEYSDQAKEADPLFQANAVKQEFIRNYWRAHWTMPSPTMGYEMFQRTDDVGEGDAHSLPSGGSVKTVIGRDDMRRLFRAAGYEPWWRDKLIAISYNPLTRIDSRRMYLASLIDDDRFYRSQLDLGYSEKNAALILDWMRAQKKAAQVAQAEKHVGPLVSHMLDLYRRGLMSEPDVKTQAISLGFTAEDIDLKVRVVDLERQKDQALTITKGLHRLYVDGFITEEETGQRAEQAGFPPNEWVRLRDEWRIEREFRVHNADEHRARELTKAQLLTAYKDALLSQPDLIAHLKTMGYHDDEIAIWIALADHEEAKRIADLRREAVHADFVDEIIDLPAARAQLVHIQLPPEHVDALLSRWVTEQRRREPRLTVQQIERLFVNQLIDDGKVRGLLHGLRYHDREIDALLQLWRLDVGVTAERLKLAQERFAVQQQQFGVSREDRAKARAEAAAQRVQAATTATQRRAEASATAFQRQETRATEQAARAQARLDKQLSEARTRQDAAFAERDKLATAANQARTAAQSATDARQKVSLQATADRQQRAFEHADKTAQTRQTERLDAEKRAQQYKIETEGRTEQRRLAAETRAHQFRIETETRGEARALRRELRGLSAQRSREERAQAARVAAEQRVAERQSTLAAAQASAQQQIAALRQQQGLPIQTSAESDFQDAATAARQRLGQIGQ